MNRMLPFDQEFTEGSEIECRYDVDLGTLQNAEEALQLVKATRARLEQGRRLRPQAEHAVLVATPEGVAREIRHVLFPSLGVGADSLTIHRYPSWRTDDTSLLPEPARSAEDNWLHLASAFDACESLTASVTGTVAEGLRVDVGHPAFLPSDQIELTPIANLDELIGHKLEVRVVQFDRRTSEIVVSRRAILEERRDFLKAQLLPKVREGASLRGRVHSLTSYGAFIDLGGIVALLHASDVPACAGQTPPEIFAVGDDVTVSVLSYDPDREWIKLGLAA